MFTEKKNDFDDGIDFQSIEVVNYLRSSTNRDRYTAFNKSADIFIQSFVAT